MKKMKITNIEDVNNRKMRCIGSMCYFNVCNFTLLNETKIRWGGEYEINYIVTIYGIRRN